MKILLVEDETPTAMMMVYLLGRAGHQTELARTGRGAIDLASERRFDVIALDVSLPDLTGFEVCRDLKQRHISYQTPIVFMSGHATAERRQQAFELGAVDFIAKPFEALDFLNRIESLCRNYSNVFNERANANAQSLGNAAQGNQ